MKTKPTVNIVPMVDWQFAKRMCLRTVGLDVAPGKAMPTAQQKLSWLMAEHSHIKCVQYCVDIDNLRQWVGVHLLRHPFVLPFVCSQRQDRTPNPEEAAQAVLAYIKDDIVNDPDFDRENWRDYRLQGSTNNHSFVMNAQTFINMSRKRLCNAASKETREAWKLVHEAIKECDPELAAVMVPNCIYRGFCPEMHCCGFVNTEAYKQQLAAYRSLIGR